MKIKLSPQLRTDSLTLTVSGTVLTCNDLSTDLSIYVVDPDQPHDWIVGQPAEAEGDWTVTVILPIPQDASEAQRFPVPVTVTEGEVPLPEPDPITSEAE